MKRKSTAVIGMVVCVMIMATMTWALPGVPNGTVTDGNLVWLQNANCFGKQNWNQATGSAANLQSGSCGLTDGSKAGQWRLATKDELIARQANQSGFNNVQKDWYWTGTELNYDNACCVFMVIPFANYISKKNEGYVWPVRSGP